jgi:hypothetical protein
MSGLENMRARMNWAGGDMDGRLNKGKLKSMQGALWNSYQAEWITLKDDQVDEEGNSLAERWRCLINPDKLKEDYDQKEISIEFESGLKEGDTFLWDRTKSHWIVFLQQFTEEAYFRAQIRRCDYQIDIDGTKYWTYLRGPMETDIQWKTKHNISFNELNYSLLMYIPKNEQTMNFFERFKIIKFDNRNWEVQVVDRYSQRGVIEVSLMEYFNNDMEDAVVGPEIVQPDTEQPYIDGPQIVNVYDTDLTYEIKNTTSGYWAVNSNKVKITNSNENQCVIDILTGKSASFILTYKRENEEDISLTINVESF